ncbi:MAG TPA: hypothetical protein DEB39_08420, partial [Planctomycetaceae bacterium]|nr:hypothetical protein [Planctomycetaceae bacterium]
MRKKREPVFRTKKRGTEAAKREMASSPPTYLPTHYFILYMGKSKMRRTVSFTIFLALSALLWSATAALGQGVVTHYNGSVGYWETANGWPNNDDVLDGGLKQVLIGINNNNQAFNNLNQVAVVTIGADLVGRASGINDSAFPTINANKHVLISTGGNIRTVAAIPTPHYANNPPQPVHEFIPMFVVAQGGQLEFGGGGELTLTNASRRDTSIGGGVVQVNGDLNIGSKTIFSNNESGTNGGAISIATGAYLNRGSNGGANAGETIFDSNHAAANGGAVASESGGTAYFHGNTTFQNNWARGLGNTIHSNQNNWRGGSSGGAVSMINSVFRFDSMQTTFTANASSQDGGAIYAENGSNVQFRGSDVNMSNNVANWGSGGAIYLNHESMLTTALGTDLSFVGNSAFYHGGAISAENGSDLRFNGGGLYPIIFQGNTAGVVANMDNTVLIGGSDGGGIYANASNVWFVDPTADVAFLSNQAGRNGGGMAMIGNKNLTFGGTAEFTGNTANNSGGGLYTNQATVKFVFESAFTGNMSGSDGAGMYANGGSVAFTGATRFVDNIAMYGSTGGDGGGVFATGTTFVFHDTAYFSGNQSVILYAADPTGSVGPGGPQLIVLDATSIPGPGYLARNGGGAIYATNASTFTFEKDVVIEGSWGTYGGGIYAEGQAKLYFGYKDGGGASGGVLNANPTSVLFSQNNGIYGGAINASGKSELMFNSGLGNTGESIQFLDNGNGAFTTPVNWPEMVKTSRQGGAISANDAKLTFIGQIEFRRNMTEVDWKGGAMTPNIAEISGGGAIYATNNSVFTFNSGTGSSSRETIFDSNTSFNAGGAIYSERGSTFEFTGKTTFIGNQGGLSTAGSYNGGAIYAVDSTFTFKGAENQISFRDNSVGTTTGGGSAILSDGSGGAIYATTDTVNAGTGSSIIFTPQTAVEFSGNSATQDGGAVKAELGATISFGGPAGPTTEAPNAGFRNNIAGRDGGAILIDTGATVTFGDVA